MITKKRKKHWPKFKLFRHFPPKIETENSFTCDKNYVPDEHFSRESFNTDLTSLNNSKDLVCYKEDLQFKDQGADCENSEDDTGGDFYIDLAKLGYTCKTISEGNVRETITNKNKKNCPKIKLFHHFPQKNQTANNISCDKNDKSRKSLKTVLNHRITVKN